LSGFGWLCKCDIDVMKIGLEVALGFSTNSIERIEELRQ
jgi:hypothetical protein